MRADERAGAFLALGIGKATGVPAAVVTTSGTAVANCHPAALEAHESRVPLLLLTSDRPHELRWARASQTTAQAGIFGDSVRLCLDIAAPVAGADRMRFWRTSADRAVAAATGAFGSLPGPVQMNLALREPLTPQWTPGEQETAGEPGTVGQPGTTGQSETPGQSETTVQPGQAEARGLPGLDQPQGEAGLTQESATAVEPGSARQPGPMRARGEAGQPGGFRMTGDDLPEVFRGRLDGSPWSDVGAFTLGADSGDLGSRPHAQWQAMPQHQVSPIPDVPRTLVVVGDAPEHVRRAALHFARRRGHPVLAEPFGRLRVESGAPGDSRGGAAPDDARGGTAPDDARGGAAPDDARGGAAPGDSRGGAARDDARGGVVLPHGLLLAETPFVFGGPAAPERLLVVGRLTLSRAVGELLRRSGASCEMLAVDPVWPDPSHLMERVRPWTALLADCGGSCATASVCVPWDWCEHVTCRTGRSHGTPTESRNSLRDREALEFGSVWQRAAESLTEVVDTQVPATWPSGPAAALAVLDALPDGARLFLGSSSLVRDASYVRARDGAEIVANRGLAGIDGCVSTAAGMALAEPGRAMYALVGDLTFLHDSAALMIGPDEQVPDLTVVVVNDDGGAIFETLEYGSEQAKGRDPQAFRRLFATPTGASLASLAAAFGADYVRVDDAAELAEQVRRRPEGLRVVEVRVPQSRARENRADLIKAASRALRGLDLRDPALCDPDVPGLERRGLD